MSGGMFRGIQAGSRYRIVGLPGEGEDSRDGAWLVINSTTNTAQLNCTIEFDDDEPSQAAGHEGRERHSALATVSPADLVACIEAGWYVHEDALLAADVARAREG